MKDFVYTYLFVHNFGEYSCITEWKIYVPSAGQVWGWSSIVLHFYGKSLQLDSETDFTTNGLNWSLFVGVGLVSMLSYLYRLKSTWIALLCFFWRYDTFLIKNMGGFLIFSLNVPCFLAIGFSNIDWWYSSMQNNFTSFACTSLSLLFLQVVMKRLFFYFWKPFILFSIFFER